MKNPPQDQTYLIRSWTLPPVEPGRPPSRRFMVETITRPPRRHSFDSLAELLAFLQVELAREGGGGVT